MPNLTLDVATIVAVLYWAVDLWTMTKYTDQIRSIWRHKKVVGSSRKYFFKAIIRELAFLVYWAFILNFNIVLGSLSIISLLFNIIILCLMIRYKKVTGRINWEDRVYAWVDSCILDRIKGVY
jgi:hypothetical protein